MAPPRSERLIAWLIVAVGTAETARAHIVFTFSCFVAMAGEAWKRGGSARTHIFSIGTWHQPGSNVTTLLILIAGNQPSPLSSLFNHFNYREKHACDSGRITQRGGGWMGGGGRGCRGPNVAKGRKNSPSPLLCYLLVSWPRPNASKQP